MQPKHEMIRPDLYLGKTTQNMVESRVVHTFYETKRFGIILPEQTNKARDEKIAFIRSSTDPYKIIIWCNEGFLFDVRNDYLKAHKTIPDLNKITDEN